MSDVTGWSGNIRGQGSLIYREPVRSNHVSRMLTVFAYEGRAVAVFTDRDPRSSEPTLTQALWLHATGKRILDLARARCTGREWTMRLAKARLLGEEDYLAVEPVVIELCASRFYRYMVSPHHEFKHRKEARRRHEPITLAELEALIGQPWALSGGASSGDTPAR